MNDTIPADITIAAIILAAGSSSRMGAHKLLLPLAGKPLLAWSVAAVCASDARPILLALGRDAAAVADSLPRGPYSVVINPHFADGMGTTLALAIGQLPPDVAGTLVLLGDQPFMTTHAIQATIAAARQEPARIIMGDRADQRGHPVYLPRRVFARAQTLRADEGARAIIAEERDAIRLIPIADEYAQFDVDTQTDYERAQAIAQSAGNTPA